MTQINWGILDPNAVGNIAAMTQQGFQQGQALRKDAETKKAIGVLAMDPTNQQATQDLIKWNPEVGYKVAQDQRETMQKMGQQDILRRAYMGDKEAMAQAFGFDPDLVMKLDDNTKAQLKQSVDFISNAALEIDRLPEDQRAGAWSNYVRIAEQRGMDIPTEYEQYSPQVLQAAIAEAGAVSKLLEGREPKYQVIPEGGMLVNTRDQSALAQVGGGQQPQGGATDQEAASIIAGAKQSKVITPEDFSRIQQALGPNGQQAAQRWMQENGIQIGKQINGKTYVQRGGEWYEVN